MKPVLTTRGKARRRAVEILFEAEQRQTSAESVVSERELHTEQTINAMTRSIVRGYIEQASMIDELLGTYSQGWSLERMPAVDRAILRVGAWEILFADENDVPAAVAVKEATDIARELSTDDSPAFVNGLLGRIQKIKPTLSLDS